MSLLAYKFLDLNVPKEYVYHVKLNRPAKRNALSHEMWLEIKECFEKLSDDENCRAVVLSGEGKVFTAGIDLTSFISQGGEVALQEDVARKAKIFHKLIQTYQESMTSLEMCKKPVLAAIHSACIGAGVDLITAADIRYCTKDAFFQVKEVDVGLAADVGSLQRLPKIIGSDSLARELSYTARKLNANEALTCGLVSNVFGSKEEMMQYAINVAEEIAKKSPVAVQTSKRSLVYSRDHSVQDGLDHVEYDIPVSTPTYNLEVQQTDICHLSTSKNPEIEPCNNKKIKILSDVTLLQAPDKLPNNVQLYDFARLYNQMNLQSEDLVLAATGQMTRDNSIKFSKL